MDHPTTLEENGASTVAIDYEAAVEQFYQPLYRFGLGLAGNPADAADLTQETFRVLLLKAGQIREPQKLKSWLFTTLYRRFLVTFRHLRRFPEVNFEEAESELPAINAVEHLDSTAVMSALQALEEKYRTPLVMFYLQELSYREIASVVGIPIGTVMSRLSRGKQILRHRLEAFRHPLQRCRVDVAVGEVDSQEGAACLGPEISWAGTCVRPRAHAVASV